jgi:AraC-like DNA-binding protein
MPHATTRKPLAIPLPEYGIYLLESHHAPGFRMQAEQHSFLELFYVLKGSGRFEIDGQWYACQKHDVVVVPPRVWHAIADDSVRPLSLYALCVAGDLAWPDAALLKRLPTGRVRLGKGVLVDWRRSFRSLLFEQTRARPFSPTIITGQTMQLLASLARHRPADTPCAESAHGGNATARRASIERYVAGLSHRFFESLSLDEAAAELSLSRRRFTTLFHEVTGDTWAGYVAAQRMKYAKALLRGTERSIVSIAFECGYEELSSFYRAFKAATGVSPGQWRKSGHEG